MASSNRGKHASDQTKLPKPKDLKFLKQTWQQLHFLFNEVLEDPENKVQKERLQTIKDFQKNYDNVTEILNECKSICSAYQASGEKLLKYKIDCDRDIHKIQQNAKFDIEKIESEKQSQIDALRMETESLRERAKELESNLVSTSEKQLRKHSFQLEQENESYKQRVDDLTTRLAGEMGYKVSADESSLENVSIKHRPMNIAEAYSVFCSNEWLDAKGFLDRKCKKSEEQDKLMLLNHIILTSANTASDVHDQILKTISKHLFHQLDDPISVLKDASRHSLTEFQHTQLKDTKKRKTDKPQENVFHLPKELRNSIQDLLRVRAETTDTEELCQDIYAKVQETTGSKTMNYHKLWNKVKVNPSIKDFILKITDIAWKMALQRPKMTFEWEGVGEPWRGETLQELNWKSEPPSEEAVVGCYGYPVMYHGDRLMATGKVMLVKTPRSSARKSKNKVH